MAETFTKLNKKFAQPQQKEISKKNTPRQKRKVFVNNNETRVTSREKNVSQESSNRQKLSSRSKSNAKRTQPMSNMNLNFNIGAKAPSNVKVQPPEEGEITIKNNLQNINLPSINKNPDNAMKFDHSLVGFATRSLSKNGALKIQKAQISLNKTSAKNEPNSGTTLNSKNSLINVPKKYQYRGKRLNIDSQSITSSVKSGATSENFQKQHAFHTKSGPIQTNEALCINSNKNSQMCKSRKIVDYKLKGISSPPESLLNKNLKDDHTKQDFSSVVQKRQMDTAPSHRRTESQGSVKETKAKKSKQKPKKEIKKEDIGKCIGFEFY